MQPQWCDSRGHTCSPTCTPTKTPAGHFEVAHDRAQNTIWVPGSRLGRRQCVGNDREVMTPLFSPHPMKMAPEHLGSRLAQALLGQEASPRPKSRGPTGGDGEHRPHGVPRLPLILLPQNYRSPSCCLQPTRHPARPPRTLPACCRFFLPTAAPMTLSSSSSEAPARRWSRRDTSEFPKRQTWRGSHGG